MPKSCQRPMGMSSDLRMLILKSLKLIDRELASRSNKFTRIGKVTPHANTARPRLSPAQRFPNPSKNSLKVTMSLMSLMGPKKYESA